MLEHYAESTSTRTCINLYHPGEQKYHLTTEVVAIVRSYIDDTETTYASEIKLRDVTDPPQGEAKNEVLFLRINNVAMAGATQKFDNEVIIPFETNIGRGSLCQIDHCIQCWLKGDPADREPTDPHVHRPSRYTQNIKLQIENRLTDTVTVGVSTNAGKSWENVEITPGNSKTIIDVTDAKPGREAYRYKLLLI